MQVSSSFFSFVFLCLHFSSFVFGVTSPQPGGAPKPSGFALSWPFASGTRLKLSSGYGPYGGSSYHKGLNQRYYVNDYYAIDIVLESGSILDTPVLAPASGTVKLAGSKECYGNRIYIEHDFRDGSSNFVTLYAHLNSIATGIHAGKRVNKGDVIGYVGTTGCSSGPHLHFALYKGAYQSNGYYIGQATVPEPMDSSENLVAGGVYTSGNSAGNTPQPTQPPTQCGVVYRTTFSLNLRSCASTACPSYVTMPANVEVYQLSSNTQYSNGYYWRNVQYGSYKGWAADNWLSFVRSNPCDNPPPPPPPGCGRACADCIFQVRTDIIPFYQANGWPASTCEQRNAIKDNWCQIDPSGCQSVQRDYCSSQCNYIQPSLECGSVCTQCIDEKLNLVEYLKSMNYSLDLTCANQDDAVLNYCLFLDQGNCSEVFQNQCSNECKNICGVNCTELDSNMECINNECQCKEGFKQLNATTCEEEIDTQEESIADIKKVSMIMLLVTLFFIIF